MFHYNYSGRDILARSGSSSFGAFASGFVYGFACTGFLAGAADGGPRPRPAVPEGGGGGGPLPLPEGGAGGGVAATGFCAGGGETLRGETGTAPLGGPLEDTVGAGLLAGGARPPAANNFSAALALFFSYLILFCSA